MHNLSINILNWNGIEYTNKCIESLLDSDKISFDILILDNGSTQDEAKLIKAKFGDKVSVHRVEKNLGFAGGHNYMLSTLLKDKPYSHYLLLNQDVIVEPNCINMLLEKISTEKDIAVVGPKVLEADGITIQSLGADINLLNGKVISKLHKQPDDTKNISPIDVDCVLGNCFLISKKIVDEIGLFDEMYFAYYEEADWCMRAKQQGYRCVILPQARISHSKPGGFRAYLNMRNMIWFEKKFASYYQLVFFFFYYWLRFVPERIKKGSPISEIIRGSIDGWLGFNKGKYYNG